MNAKGGTFNLGTLVLVAAFVAFIGLAYLSFQKPVGPSGTTVPVVTDKDVSQKVSTFDVPRFSSCEAISTTFEESRKSYGGAEILETAIGAVMSMPMAAAPMAKASAERAPDYSTTNIQVAGVDEADIVKTDGKYIYTLSRASSGYDYYGYGQNTSLAIALAYPAKAAKVLSITKLENFSPQEMFLEDDVLLIFGQSYFKTAEVAAPKQKVALFSIVERPYYGGSHTTLQLWDVSDRANPKLKRSLDFEGSYLSSRKIGSYAYFVINTYPRYYTMGKGKKPEEILPTFRERLGSVAPAESEKGSAPIAKCTEVGYLPHIRPESFVTIGSVSMKNFSSKIKKEVVVGSGQNVYASLENLYLAAETYEYYPMPLAAASRIGILPPETSSEKTTIHKFALKNGEIEYASAAKAPGTILNQFSMDEFDNHFRIATTIGHVSRQGGGTTNNIYIFDDKLNRVGKLEDLAPGERIYSARFMGKRGYLVTFKKVDPLFAIDLSNPKNPRVLGKLKIPGYSDYLHPIDDDHLIGVGKETVEAEEGDFAWYQGIKMAVFDVSDVEHPKEMHKVVIGDRGTDSPVLSDHKAFLFDKKKSLLVIPVLVAKLPDDVKERKERAGSEYGEFIFQGAFVFNLTLENGFNLEGKVTHLDDDESFKKSGYYYGSDQHSVKRSLYIGDVLYTISDGKIKANELWSLDEIKSLSLAEENEEPEPSEPGEEPIYG